MTSSCCDLHLVLWSSHYRRHLHKKKKDLFYAHPLLAQPKKWLLAPTIAYNTPKRHPCLTIQCHAHPTARGGVLCSIRFAPVIHSVIRYPFSFILHSAGTPIVRTLSTIQEKFRFDETLVELSKPCCVVFSSAVQQLADCARGSNLRRVCPRGARCRVWVP